MKNNELILRKLDDDLAYLYEQEKRLKPILDILMNRIQEGLTLDELSVLDAFDIFLRVQEQYTNSILLIAKIQETIKFKE